MTEEKGVAAAVHLHDSPGHVFLKLGPAPGVGVQHVQRTQNDAGDHARLLGAVAAPLPNCRLPLRFLRQLLHGMLVLPGPRSPKLHSIASEARPRSDNPRTDPVPKASAQRRGAYVPSGGSGRFLDSV